MPIFGKESLSRYVATGCQKQLFSNLFPPRQDPALQQQRLVRGIPRIQTPRPGLSHYRDAGHDYEAEKFADLVGAFGQESICGDPYDANGVMRYRRIVLLPRLEDLALQAGRFLVEAEFNPDVPSIRQALGVQDVWAPVPGNASPERLHLAVLRPDIIQVCAPGTHPFIAQPDGEVSATEAADDRLQLRIIDVKLTSEPSAGYFAQVVYYSMALAAFIEYRHLGHRFTVVAAEAIWPGSHAESNLNHETQCQLSTGQTDHAALLAALESDLELAPHSVFAYRIRKIMREDVRDVLQTSLWAEQPWHVDASCSGCPYLGHPRPHATGDAIPHPHHCMPTAESTNHLSRVAFLSPAARETLEAANVTTVEELANLSPQHAAFDAHPSLRAGRVILPARAGALLSNAAVLPDQGATSALLPSWADLRICVTAHFDSTSALTTVLGWDSFSIVPRGYGISYPGDTLGQAPAPQHPPAIVTQARSLEAEREALLQFLHGIDDLLSQTDAADQARRAWCTQEHGWIHPDPARAHPDTKVQFYIWDQLQYEHIGRVVGRHLPFILADQSLRRLAWLFPPDEILQNPKLIGTYKGAPLAPPVTIVREVIRSLIAAPTPHWYGLLEVAREYHPPELPHNMASFVVPELFQGEFSDQIPSERAFDLWTGSHPNAEEFRWTARTHLRALAAIARRATTDLDSHLRSVAHSIAMLGSIPRERKLAVDSQLWFAFSKLDAAMDALDKRELRSLPINEREARFVSARLVSRLTGAEADEALANSNLEPRLGRLVYQLGEGSIHIKVRPGDQGYALAPSDDPAFLDKSFNSLVPQLAGNYGEGIRYRRMDELTSVTVAAIDRDLAYIVVDHSFPFGLIGALDGAGLNFTTDVMLDPRPNDHFTKPLRASLVAIGNPSIAAGSPLIQQVRNATGQIQGSSNVSARNPAADFLWDAQATYDSESSWADAIPGIRDELTALGVDLNESQWEAWEQVLTHRLRLVWGPPGTGKTKLAAAIILGAILAAEKLGRATRILVCATTYTALDNVLRELFALPLPDITVRRLKSASQPSSDLPDTWPDDVDLITSSDAGESLRDQLSDGSTTVVVAATPQQVARLIDIANTESTDPLFDLGLVDEASQMDVAHATLPLCALAEGSSLVMIGDPKQLPPIHKANPPAGLEAMVGSVYGYFTSIGNIPGDLMLNRNYRSNQTIVDFARFAGYLPGLESENPERLMPLVSELPSTEPPTWPSTWTWTPDFADFLDPAKPAVAVVHADRLSSQWSDVEAETVAALVWLLRSRLGTSTEDGLLVPYTDSEFWAKGVGIVTPHRAQQGLITSRLQTLFPGAARSAVDTVERFQGQQREVIIASFAIGDIDAIRNEEEFLYSLERFNVMASRARSKLIVLLSWGVLDHLADDPDLLRASELLKRYVYTFCNMEQTASIIGPTGLLPALFRWRPQN